MKTGFENLDKILKIENGDIVLMEGSPCVGKSTFALKIAYCTAVEEKIPTAIFSVECVKVVIQKRIMQIATNRESYNELKKTVPFPEFAGVPEFIKENIYLNDKPNITIEEVINIVKELKKEGVSLLIIDYLQLVAVKKEYKYGAKKQSEEVFKILKKIAKEMNITVIVISSITEEHKNEIYDNKLKILNEDQFNILEKEANSIIFLERNDNILKNIDIVVSKNNCSNFANIDLFSTLNMNYKSFTDIFEDVKKEMENNMRKERILEEVKKLLKKELKPLSYNMWIKDLEIESIKYNKITLITKSNIQKEGLEVKLLDLLLDCFELIMKQTCKIEIVVKKYEEK